MRTVRKLTLVLGASIAALALGGPASAHSRTNRPIVMRAVAVPTFLDATSDCPAFSLREQLVSTAAVPRGWFEFCLATFSPDPTGGDDATGTATFHLRGGTIETTLTLIEVPTATGVVQTDSGTVFHGTGRYRGATGTLSGGGPIVFDTTGKPHPDLTLTLMLRAARGVPLNAVDSGAAAVVSTVGSVIQTADTGSGRASHLGRFRLVAGEHVDLATGVIADGFYTLTAAHGDTISGTYTGRALAGLTGYLVSGPITGGTGRFAGATGFLVWSGTLNATTFTFSDVLRGWFSSPRGRRGRDE